MLMILLIIIYINPLTPFNIHPTNPPHAPSTEPPIPYPTITFPFPQCPLHSHLLPQPFPPPFPSPHAPSIAFPPTSPFHSSSTHMPLPQPLPQTPKLLTWITLSSYTNSRRIITVISGITSSTLARGR